ncbi:hypothetical protein SAMN04488090_1913 [Siphonobacter aquaeclarae]|uniref:Glycosyltransferase 2-like domain-containing protein n=2 Tax=Siphonobacter aquaeclarae TaxID=563176 RepID=A0A1G9N8T1_9BACT|nr:hypothetical protein SAMN04488090_1913 [Siphonobacter aquaeclarae]
MLITAAIVTYRNDLSVLSKAIESVLTYEGDIRLYIIDNSPDKKIKTILDDPRIEYVHIGENLGFGKAHNVAIRLAEQSKSTYHIVVNPDIYFDAGELEKMVDFLNRNPKYGLMMPRIIYPDGSNQYLCKRPPSLSVLVLRRFMPGFIRKMFQKKLDYFEYRDHSYNGLIEDVPYLSGCFMFFRTDILVSLGGFEERIFMYMEDADITFRTLKISKTVYFPGATVTHMFAKGSYKNFKLMYYNIEGAVIYFQKWGLNW